MINHLITYSVVHWDQTMRELAAESLGMICKMDVPYTESNVIPKLVKKKNSYVYFIHKNLIIFLNNYIFTKVAMANSPELNDRHGALVALGEVCHNCYYDISINNDNWWTEKQLNDIIKVINK